MKILVVAPELEDLNYRGVQFVTKHVVRAFADQGHEVVLLTSYPKISLTVGSERMAERVHNTYIRQYLVNGGELTRKVDPKQSNWRVVLRFLKAFFFQKSPVTKIDKDKSVGIPLLPFFDAAVNLPYFYRLIGILPKIVRKFALQKIIKTVKPDAVFFSFPVVVPKLKGVKTIQIIYDLIPFEIAEESPENNWLTKLAKQIDYVTRNSDLVFTISDDSEAKIKEVEPTTFLHNIGAAISAFDYERPLYETDSPVLIQNDLVGKEFIIFISSVERRKNVHRLIQAFIAIADKTTANLVIIGNKTYAFKDIFKEVEKAPKHIQKRIIFTGYANEHDKYTLLKHAIALVNPTLYEGFGLPVLEAFALGCPAVSSVRGALAEVAGEAVLKIDNPYSVGEISQKLLKILKDPQLRVDLIRKGTEQSKKYTEQVMYEKIKAGLAKL